MSSIAIIPHEAGPPLLRHEAGIEGAGEITTFVAHAETVQDGGYFVCPFNVGAANKGFSP